MVAVTSYENSEFRLNPEFELNFWQWRLDCMTAEVETGLIPEIFSIKIKEKISNVSEDSIRHTFTIY